jgi:Uncharacterized protein conserved in bacteria (DUF2188)
MLGRHVYRVSPRESDGWNVSKEGEAQPRASRPSCEEATRVAFDLASADAPSKVVIEERDGTIASERLFGADTATALERQAEGQDPDPSSSPRR